MQRSLAFILLVALAASACEAYKTRKTLQEDGPALPNLFNGNNDGFGNFNLPDTITQDPSTDQGTTEDDAPVEDATGIEEPAPLVNTTTITPTFTLPNITLPNITHPNFTHILPIFHNFTIDKNITIIIIKPEAEAEAEAEEEAEEVIEVPMCKGAVNASCCAAFPLKVYEVVKVDPHTGEVTTSRFTAEDQTCTFTSVEVIVIKPQCHSWDVCPCDWCDPDGEITDTVTTEVELELLADVKYPPAVWSGEDDFYCYCDPDVVTLEVVAAPSDEECEVVYGCHDA